MGVTLKLRPNKQYSFNNIAFDGIFCDAMYESQTWLTDCKFCANSGLQLNGSRSHVECNGCKFIIAYGEEMTIYADGPCKLYVRDCVFKSDDRKRESYDDVDVTPCITVSRAEEIDLELCGNKFINARYHLIGDEHVDLLSIKHDAVLENNKVEVSEILELFKMRAHTPPINHD